MPLKTQTESNVYSEAALLLLILLLYLFSKLWANLFQISVLNYLRYTLSPQSDKLDTVVESESESIPPLLCLFFEYTFTPIGGGCGGGGPGTNIN